MTSLGAFRYGLDATLESPLVKERDGLVDEHETELRLETEQGFEVTVHVEDESSLPRDRAGRPVVATVERRDETGAFKPASGTTPDGTFTIRWLRAGAIALRAAPVPGGPAGAPGPERTVDAGAEGVALVLGR